MKLTLLFLSIILIAIQACGSSTSLNLADEQSQDQEVVAFDSETAVSSDTFETGVLIVRDCRLTGWNPVNNSDGSCRYYSCKYDCGKCGTLEYPIMCGSHSCPGGKQKSCDVDGSNAHWLPPSY